MQKLDKHGRAYATGKRKNAVARVWIKPGTGKITVNGRDVDGVFRAPGAAHDDAAAAGTCEPRGQYDVIVHGRRRRPLWPGRRRAPRPLQGAHLLRAGAAHGPQAEGFLTRDCRVVERKKYGKAKARRSFQFSKR